MSLTSPQYSNLRQSLRQMSHTDPPLPKDTARQNGDSCSSSMRYSSNLRDLLRHGKGLRTFANRTKRKKNSCNGGRGEKEGQSSDNNASSFTGTKPSSSRTTNRGAYSYDSIQPESFSEDSLLHQQEATRDLTSYFYGDDDHESDQFFDAEVSYVTYSGNDDYSFDYDCADQRCTFDYDYNQYHLQTLTTLQQHLAQKRENSRNPIETSEDEIRVDILDVTKSMEYTGMLELELEPQSTQQLQSSLSKPATKGLSEQYAIRKRSIDNSIDSAPIDDILGGTQSQGENDAIRESSINNIIDPTLMDDTLGGTQDQGDNTSTVSMLHEMGLRLKSKKPLPDWVDDLLGCYTAESIDPEVLKELVDATFGEYADEGSQNYDTIVIEDQSASGTDSMVWREQQHATEVGDGKISMIYQQKPLRRFKTEQSHGNQTKSCLSTISCDTRGPIPADVILRSSFTSILEPHKLSHLLTDDLLRISSISSMEEPRRVSNRPTDNILGSSFTSSFTTIKTSMVKPHRVSNLHCVVEDARGPIPADDILNCTSSALSDNTKGGNAGGSSYGFKKDDDSPGCASRSNAKNGIKTPSKSLYYDKGGSACSLSYHGVEKDDVSTSSKYRGFDGAGGIDISNYNDKKGAKTPSTSRGYNTEEIVGSSRYGFKKDGGVASASKTYYDNYSELKSWPPINCGFKQESKNDDTNTSSGYQGFDGAGNVGSSSYDNNKGIKTLDATRSCMKKGITCGSNCGFEKDSDMACASRTSYGNYSDLKSWPPINPGLQKDNESTCSESKGFDGVGSLCGSGYNGKEADKTVSASRSYNKEGIVRSSSYDSKNDSDMAIASKTFYGNCSDQKPSSAIDLLPNKTIQSLSQKQPTYYTPSHLSSIKYTSDEAPPIRDVPLPPPLRRYSSSWSSLDEEPKTPPDVACTKPILGFLSRRRVTPCGEDTQTASMKMRCNVLESMSRNESREKKRRQPITI